MQDLRLQTNLRNTVNTYLAKGWEVKSRNPLTLVRGKSALELINGVFNVANDPEIEKFPMGQYMTVVRSAQNAYTHWRYGQILFNVLHDGWPEIADHIRGSNIDPFFVTDKDDERIDRFFLYLAAL